MIREARGGRPPLGPPFPLPKSGVGALPSLLRRRRAGHATLSKSRRTWSPRRASGRAATPVERLEGRRGGAASARSPARRSWAERRRRCRSSAEARKPRGEGAREVGAGRDRTRANSWPPSARRRPGRAQSRRKAARALAAEEKRHDLRREQRAEDDEKGAPAGPDEAREGPAGGREVRDAVEGREVRDRRPSNGGAPAAARRAAKSGQLLDGDDLGLDRGPRARLPAVFSRVRATIAGAPSVTRTPATCRGEEERVLARPPPSSRSDEPSGKAASSSRRTARRCAATLSRSPKRSSKRSATASKARTGPGERPGAVRSLPRPRAAIVAAGRTERAEPERRLLPCEVCPGGVDLGARSSAPAARRGRAPRRGGGRAPAGRRGSCTFPRRASRGRRCRSSSSASASCSLHPLVERGAGERVGDRDADVVGAARGGGGRASRGCPPTSRRGSRAGGTTTGRIPCCRRSRVARRTCSTRVPLSIASRIFWAPDSTPIQTSSQPGVGQGLRRPTGSSGRRATAS